MEDPSVVVKFPKMNHKVLNPHGVGRASFALTRRLAGFEILNNAILIFQKWLVSRHFANIFHYLNFYEEYL